MTVSCGRFFVLILFFISPDTFIEHYIFHASIKRKKKAVYFKVREFQLFFV